MDADNKPIGPELRSTIKENKWWYRASNVFIYTPKGFLVQKRSMAKAFCPGYYDLDNGGAMDYGETDL